MHLARPKTGHRAARGERAFVGQGVDQVAEGREEYTALGRELGLLILPSATNFVAIDLGSGARARAAMASLLERDVFVRMPGVAPLDRCIRVTVGTPAERIRFAEVFREVLESL